MIEQENKIKEKKKSRPISIVEWFILWFASMIVFYKCEVIYEESQGQNLSMLVLAACGVILFLFSSAKLGMFNIFLAIRRLPKELKKIWKEQLADIEKFRCDDILEERKFNDE